MPKSSSEAVVVTEQGAAIKTRAVNVRTIPESESFDVDRILGMRAVQCSPDGSDNAPDIQVGMERPAEMMLALQAKFLMENKVARTYLRRADFDQWDPKFGCPGCGYLRTGPGRQQTHSEACRRRTEAQKKGDSSGSARLAAAAAERINRALAESRTTRDQGSRNDGHIEEGLCRLSSRVGASEENRAGHRAGLASPQALTRTSARAT